LAYKALSQKGYRNLRVLDEGIPGWIEQGHPTEGTKAEGRFEPHPYGLPYAVGSRPVHATVPE